MDLPVDLEKRRVQREWNTADIQIAGIAFGAHELDREGILTLHKAKKFVRYEVAMDIGDHC